MHEPTGGRVPHLERVRRVRRIRLWPPFEHHPVARLAGHDHRRAGDLEARAPRQVHRADAGGRPAVLDLREDEARPDEDGASREGDGCVRDRGRFRREEEEPAGGDEPEELTVPGELEHRVLGTAHREARQDRRARRAGDPPELRQSLVGVPRREEAPAVRHRRVDVGARSRRRRRRRREDAHDRGDVRRRRGGGARGDEEEERRGAHATSTSRLLSRRRPGPTDRRSSGSPSSSRDTSSRAQSSCTRSRGR